MTLIPYISEHVRRSSITGNYYIDCTCGHTVAERNAVPIKSRYICLDCFEAYIGGDGDGQRNL